MTEKIGIGIQEFDEIREGKCFYIDTSVFYKSDTRGYKRNRKWVDADIVESGMKLRRGDVLENKNTIMDRLNETDIAKYTIKDSVFTNLFQDKKYRV